MRGLIHYNFAKAARVASQHLILTIFVVNVLR